MEWASARPALRRSRRESGRALAAGEVACEGATRVQELNPPRAGVQPSER